jgi:HK97 family phage major capsid protein
MGTQETEFRLKNLYNDLDKLMANHPDGVRLYKLVDQIQDLEAERDYLSGSRSRIIRPDVNSSGRLGRQIFSSFGEQLQAICSAVTPGGKVDPRLHEVRAATGLSESVPADGGYLISPTYSSDIIGSAFESAQFARLCRDVSIGANSNSTKVNAVDETSRVSTRWGGLLAYWLDEAQEKVPSKPKFRQMELTLKKLVILGYATDELLSDATLLDQTLRRGFQEEIAFKVDDGIIRGNGAAQMLGILNSGCLATVTRTTPGSIVVGDITSMWARLLPGSHSRAVWITNPDCLPTLYTMAMGTGTNSGVSIFMPGGSIAGQPYATIFNRPLIVSEMASSLASAGSLMLCDFSHYLLISKGLKVDMSVHVAWTTDQSCYRGVLRIDGMPDMAAKVTPYKGANDLSPFVSLSA